MKVQLQNNTKKQKSTNRKPLNTRLKKRNKRTETINLVTAQVQEQIEAFNKRKTNTNYKLQKELTQTLLAPIFNKQAKFLVKCLVFYIVPYGLQH